MSVGGDHFNWIATLKVGDVRVGEFGQRAGPLRADSEEQPQPITVVQRRP